VAKPSKKLSRKDLKQPDEFQTKGERALEHLHENRNKYFLVIIAIIAVAGLVSGANAFWTYRQGKISKHYANAMEAYTAPVVAMGEKDKPEGLSFPSDETKYMEALRRFGEISSSYSSSSYGELSVFYAGNCHFKLKRYDKAAEAYAKFIDEAGSSMESIVFLAHNNMAQSLEMKGELDKAYAEYQILIDEDAELWKEQAYFFQAYILEKQEKKEDAVKKLEKLLEEYPETSLKAKAEKRLMVLKG